MKRYRTQPSKTGIFSWCLYDWANSAFPTIILTFVFSTYFTEKVAENSIVGTSLWAKTIAIASLVIAVLSPFLGAIADREGRRKPWIGSFAALSIVSAGLLWFSKPDPSYANWTLVWVALGLIGLEVSIVFYNAMLKDLAPKSYIGRISGWSWGLGYFGGLLSLLVALFVFVQNDIPWLDKSVAEPIRICGPLVALWYLAFGWPIIVWTKDQESRGISYYKAMKLGITELVHTIFSLRKYKEIVKFLIAHLIYIDGLNTLFAFGGIYAAGTFGMTFNQIIQFGIAMNVAAGVGAIGLAWLDDYWGAKPTIIISLFIMLISGIGMLVTTSQMIFWVLGMGLSFCVGPVQAASRSLMVRLSPPHLVTEMFGLFALSGKATAFIGPWLVGGVTFFFKSQRIGMSTVMVFLLVGTVILFSVREKSHSNRSP